MDDWEKYGKQAPKGKIWQCTMCGKKSYDVYGDKKISYGWDESCAMNAVLVEDIDTGKYKPTMRK